MSAAEWRVTGNSLWPADWLHIGFFSLQFVLTLIYRDGLSGAGLWLAFDVTAVVTLILLVKKFALVSLGRQIWVRLFHGFLVVPLVFTQVGLLIFAMDAPDYAPELEAIDRQIFFGRNPLEALEAWSHPILTELLQWAYTAYIILPPVTGLILHFRRDRLFAARSLFSILLVFYVSYIGYYLVPAAGPNIHNNFGPIAPCGIEPMPLYTFQTELPGVFLWTELRQWMFDVELTKKDCFPSGHVAIAVLCAILVIRVRRGLGLAMAWLSAAIIFSTVYLRYHYVIDIVAGVALAFLADIGGRRLHRRFEPMLSSRLEPEIPKRLVSRGVR